MRRCSNIGPSRKKVCAASLKEPIIIHTRSLQGAGYGVSDVSISLTDQKTVWSAIKTLSPGSTYFDGVNQERRATHDFVCRYDDLPDIEAGQDWIEYAGRYFDILMVESANEQREFVIIRSNERGQKTNEVSLS